MNWLIEAIQNLINPKPKNIKLLSPLSDKEAALRDTEARTGARLPREPLTTPTPTVMTAGAEFEKNPGSVLGATSIPTPYAPYITPSVMNEVEDKTWDTFKNYEIPPQVAYGIATGEGGKIGSNNLYNIGAHDSNPDNAVNYDSQEQAATAAAKLLSGTFRKDDPVNGPLDTRYLDAWNKRQIPVEMLRAIEEAGYAGDPKTWKQRSIEQGKKSGVRGAGEIYDKWSNYIMDTEGWNRWNK
jgi:hypothetical protein